MEGRTVNERLRRIKLAAVVAVSLLIVGVTGALGAVTFRDPVGDVEGGAGPDLTGAFHYRLTG